MAVTRKGFAHVNARDMVYHPDGKHLLTCGAGGEVHVFEADKLKEPVATSSHHEETVNTIAIHPQVSHKAE